MVNYNILVNYLIKNNQSLTPSRDIKSYCLSNNIKKLKYKYNIYFINLI